MKSIRYVKAKAYAVGYFAQWKKPVTEGNIYEFPDITYDDGQRGNLANDARQWRKEFEFLKETPNQQTYEIY